MTKKLPAWKVHLEWMIGAGLASLFLGVFIKITAALRANTVLPQIDLYVLTEVATRRTTWVTRWADDVTALGSPALLAIVCVVTIAILIWVARDYWAALQMAIASAGAGLWVGLGKQMIGRVRPEALHALVNTEGYSYPSGHSLASAAMYLTVALIAVRWIRAAHKRWAMMGMTLALIGLIGFSRVYLGVHYPSDVLSGLLLGSAWALLLESGATYWRGRNGGNDTILIANRR